MRRWFCALGALLLGLWAAPARSQAPFVFEDVSATSGLNRYLEGDAKHRPWRYAHGSAWGDVDGDGRPDLFVGAFAGRAYFSGGDSPIPNRLFLNRADGFQPTSDEAVEARSGQAGCAGSAFADLDNDGDLDLVITNHAVKASQIGSRLLENTGGGKFRDVTPDEAPWNAGLGMRNVGLIDVDGDGRLDLLLTDGSYGKANEARAKLLVLRNEGALKFVEISARLGLPQEGVNGLGLALGDLNNDGRMDVFVAGSNRLFVTKPDGTFREVVADALQYKTLDVREGLRCGAAFGDLNADGLLDLVVTEHGVPTRLHVFQNKGVRDGLPDLVDVSDAAGLGETFPSGTKLQPYKTAHVALRDMDNDGRADIMLSVIYKDSKGRVQPVVLRNEGAPRGELKFARPPFDSLAGYYAPGPVADFDRDGRVDVLLPSWFEELPNYLFRNVTPGGKWLTVKVGSREKGLNPMGIGAVVWTFERGHLGEPRHLLGRADIVVGTGYASGEEALAHLGVGSADRVDLRVTWGASKMDRPDVATGQLINVEFKP